MRLSSGLCTNDDFVVRVTFNCSQNFNLLKNDTKVWNWLAFKWKGNFYYWFICMHLYMYRYMLMWYMVGTIDLNPYISMVGIISSKRRQNIPFGTLQAQKWAYGSYLPLLFCEYYNVSTTQLLCCRHYFVLYVILCFMLWFLKLPPG